MLTNMCACASRHSSCESAPPTCTAWRCASTCGEGGPACDCSTNRRQDRRSRFSRQPGIPRGTLAGFCTSTRTPTASQPAVSNDYGFARDDPLWHAGAFSLDPASRAPPPKYQKSSKRGRKPFHEKVTPISFDELCEEAQSLIGKSYTEGTQKNVATAMRAWHAFQADYFHARPIMLRQPEFAGDLRASLHNEISMMLFVVFCWRGGLAPSSSATYASLVRNELGANLGWKLTCREAETRLPRLLRGLRKFDKRRRRKRNGFRAHHHRRFMSISGIPVSEHDTARHALMATAREGLARGADMLPAKAADFDWETDVCVGDVSFVSSPERHMVLMMRPAKKRDLQEKVPVIFHSSDQPESAYFLVSQMLEQRGARASARGGALGDREPLFIETEGDLTDPKSLTIQSLRGLFKLAAGAIGLDPAFFSAHSGRIGGATDHFASGTPAIVIQICGRWDSDIWQIYARQCLGQTLQHARLAAANEDVDLEENIPGYTQPARTTRQR
jgi:hypothetical protein